MNSDPDPIELLQATVSLQRQLLANADVPQQCEHALQALMRFTGSCYGFLCESDGQTVARFSQATTASCDGATAEYTWLEAPLDVEAISSILASSWNRSHETADASAILKRALPVGHPPITSILGIPLEWKGKVVGLIGLANRPGGYNPVLVEQLAPLLAACAATLHTRRQSAEAAFRDEQSRQAELDLRNLAQSATPVVGAEFFHSLVQNLARSLEVDYAFVSQLDEDNPLRVRTIAAFGNGTALDNLSYNLEHTPCHEVVRSGPLCLPSSAQTNYPLDHWLAEVGIEGYIGIPLTNASGRVLGLVSALSRRPLRRPDAALHQMMVWAARATAELERLEAEEAVSASEARFRQLFEHSPDAIFVEDLQGNVLDVNPAACRLHDRDRRDLIGRNIAELVPPPLREAARRNFARLVAGEIDHIDGYSWVRTGHALPVAIRASRIEYFGQQAILLHVRDVSAQRAAEEALRESESQFRLVLEQLPAMVWTVNTEQRITLALGRPMANMGRTPENTVGLSLTEYFHGRWDAQQLLEYHRRALAGESIQYETQVCGIAFECRLQPLRNQQGEIVGCLGASLDVTERVQALAAVRESESRFRAIFDSSPECVKLLARDGKLLKINSAGLRMIEAESADQVVGQCMYPIVVEKYRAGFQRLVEQVFEGQGGMLEFEITGLRGGRRWLETHGTPLTDAAGRVAAALSVTRNVTDRKRAQLELLQRNQELEAIFQAYPDLYFVISESGTIEQYRAGRSSDLYVPPERFLGRRMQDVLPAEVAARFDDAFVRLSGGSPMETVEYELSISGQEPHFEARVASLDGRRIAVLVRNISDRRQLEQAIRESEARFRQFAEHLPFLVCMLSADSRNVLYVNRAAETILGRRTDSLLAKPDQWLSLVHEEDRPRIAQRLAVPFDKNPRSTEFRIVRPDGSVRWLKSLAVPLVNAQGAVYLLTVLVEDVTEQKQAAERLARKQAELLHVSRLSTMGHMVAAMSHEISQPLAALGNYSAACASLLKESPAPQPEQFRHYVGEIARQTQRAGAILRRLRAFGGRSSPDREPYALNWLLHDASELVASELRRQDVALRWDLAEPSPQILVDRIQFQQVIVNLLTNASDSLQSLEASRRQAGIRTETNNGDAVIEIVDNGPGLSPDVLNSLFEPFFTTKPNGMGLGLSICREIIEDHGGQIEAANRPQGGAVFRLRLPLESHQPTSPILARLPDLHPE